MTGNHSHRCAECGFVFKCVFDREKGTKCQVDKAVKVNKAGPFCDLCRYEEMARRIRAVRKHNAKVKRQRPCGVQSKKR